MQDSEERFYGYCQDAAGLFSPAETLMGPEEAMNYALRHMDAFHRVIVTDQGDYLFIEAVDGKIIFSLEESYVRTLIRTAAHRLGTEHTLE